jgi:hypothetical protein
MATKVAPTDQLKKMLPTAFAKLTLHSLDVSLTRNRAHRSATSIQATQAAQFHQDQVTQATKITHQGIVQLTQALPTQRFARRTDLMAARQV